MAEQISGTVGAVKGTGFKIDERWINISKFAKLEQAPMPGVGDEVAVQLDKAGFARVVEIERSANLAEKPAAVDRDGAIRRMACLNTATAILSSGGRSCEAKDVVALATKLEAWVNR